MSGVRCQEDILEELKLVEDPARGGETRSAIIDTEYWDDTFRGSKG